MYVRERKSVHVRTFVSVVHKPGSIQYSACRPSRSEFSMVFSETPVNMGQDRLERPLRMTRPYRPRSHKRTIGLIPTTQIIPRCNIYRSMNWKRWTNILAFSLTKFYSFFWGGATSSTYFVTPTADIEEHEARIYAVVCTEVENILKSIWKTPLSFSMLPGVTTR